MDYICQQELSKIQVHFVGFNIQFKLVFTIKFILTNQYWYKLQDIFIGCADGVMVSSFKLCVYKERKIEED